MRDEESLSNLLRELDKFASFSGLKINKNKSQILCPNNSIYDLHQAIHDIPIVKEAKILGIKFKPACSVQDQYNLNFKEPLRKIRQACQSWSNRNLSIKGKITVANSLLVSLLQYPCAVVPTPARVLNEYRKIITDFIWNRKHPKIAYKTLILPIEQGGLKLIDLPTRLKVTHLQWVKRILRFPDSHAAVFLSHLLNATDLQSFFAAKRSDYLRCCQHHPFYHDLLKTWNVFHVFQPEDEAGVRGESLWNNKWITNSGLMIHWHGWEKRGISKVADICHESEPRTLSQQEITGKFDMSCSFLEALNIRMSIPVGWRSLLTDQWSATNQLPPPLEIKFPSGDKRNLQDLSAKKLYCCMLEDTNITCAAFNKWQEPVDEITMTSSGEWKEACSTAFKATRETKLQSFHYKMLHRTIPCNVFLKQIRIKESEWCPYCDASDTIVHFLFRCDKVQPFWTAICNWFRNADNLYLHALTPQEYIWGLHSSAYRASMINAVTLSIKHYVYRQKLFHEANLDMMQWLQEFRQTLRAEQWISRKAGQGARFNKWRNILRALEG